MAALSAAASPSFLLAPSRQQSTVSRLASKQIQLQRSSSSAKGNLNLISSFHGSSFQPRPIAEVKRRSSGFNVTCGNVQKVNAAELDELLMVSRTVPTVIDFYATWCGPCVLLAQELERLALEYNGTVQFLKVDTDEEYELAQQLEIRGLPTMVFISHDSTKQALRTEGLLPVGTIKELIGKL